MKERFKKENLIVNLFSVPVVIYTVYLLVQIIITTFSGTAYPNEYREAANILMTDAIRSGINPYGLDTLSGSVPGVFYLYGPLFSIITAIVSLVIRIDLVTLQYAMSFLAMIVSAVLVSRMVYEHSKTITAPAAAFLFAIMCHWRYGYIYAAPDSFGLFLLILILFLLTRTKFRGRVLLCALLTVAIFFTKQYFVLIAGTAFIYFLFLSKKDAFFYALDSFVALMVSGLVIAWKFPLFWTYAIYFVKGPGSGVSSGAAGVSHNTAQVSYLGGMFICLFAVGAFDFIRTVIIKRGIRLRFQIKNSMEPLIKVEVKDEAGVYGKRSIVFDVLFWGQMAVAGICLQYLGKNDGAWISYYLQLFVPALIIVALTAIDNYSYKKIFGILHIICYALLLLVTIYKTDSRLIVNHMDEAALGNWEKAYGILDSHAEDENFYIPVLAYEGYQEGQYMYNTGQPFVITESYLKEYNQDTLMQKLFPYAGKIMEQHLDCREEIRQKVLNGAYGVITDLPENDVIFTEEDLARHYEKEATIPLKTGNWTYDVDFWTLKE